MRVKVTRLNGLSDLTCEGLREEGEGWADGDTVECGKAVLVPDDGSGQMEGFFRVNEGRGMISWGGDLSDWIEADSLEAMFRSYTANIS